LEKWRYDLRKAVHFILKPLWKIAVQYSSGALHELLREKYEKGWDQEVVAKIHKVITRFAKEHKPKGDVLRSTQFLQFADILCLLLDSERYWFPRWWNQLLKIAQEEDLLREVEEPD